MDFITTVQQALESRVLATARGTQARVIESFDRVTGAGPGNFKPFAWITGAQMEMLELVVTDPAQTIDRQYWFVARLLDLHREFAQRLFDVVEQLDGPPPEVHPDVAPVVRLDSRRATSGL